jgi:predicted ester cyclase
VADDVAHNGRQLGLAGYQTMLAANYEEIPDLHFNPELLVTQRPFVVAILRFDCLLRLNFWDSRSMAVTPSSMRTFSTAITETRFKKYTLLSINSVSRT